MTDERGYDSRAVSNKILEVARSKGIDLTIMQLLKLVYFAHGWTLALYDRPLSYHHAQAWQYGPVFPHVYRSYSGAGSNLITDPIVEKATGAPYRANLDEQALDVIDTVVEGYGREHGFRLSSITHAPGSPWDTTFKERGPYSEIPDDRIKEYFKKYIGEQQAAESV